MQQIRNRTIPERRQRVRHPSSGAEQLSCPANNRHLGEFAGARIFAAAASAANRRRLVRRAESRAPRNHTARRDRSGDAAGTAAPEVLRRSAARTEERGARA
jgi:hypothetical protein